MKKILFSFIVLFVLFILCSPFIRSQPLPGPPLTVEEEDGTPSVPGVWKIKVANGNLTDDAGGVVSVADQGGGSGGDNVTVNSSSVDTTADFDDANGVSFTLVDGGAGGPDQIRVTVDHDAITNYVAAEHIDWTGVDFLVGTATGLTANEIVAGTTPGGELGGTWDSPTIDNDALDDQYYDSEADLTALLDDNYEAELNDSAGLHAALSDETGTGVAVFGTSPTFTTSITMGDATLDEAELEILDGATLSTTQINYLASATGTTGTTNTNVVFSTSPTLVTPTLGVATATSVAVDTEVYGAGWDADLTVPTKDAVYDKIETLGSGHDAVTLSAGADTMLSLSTQEIQLDATLGSGEFFVGSGAATGAWVAMSGEATLAANGAVTLDDDALDDQYYDSEADLTTLLDDNYQPLDSELTTIAGLTETNGAVMFVTGGVWTADTTPAIDCTDCTNVPAGTVNTADIDDVSVTQTEFAELETIGATTISANQWAALGSLPETVTGTELGYTDGVTSEIQTQFSNILDGTTAFTDFNGTVIDSDNYVNGSIDLAHLAAGVYAKDIVTTAPITGGTDNVLVGADGDVTIGITVQKDIVTTAPLRVNAGANLDNVITGSDSDITFSINAASTTATGSVEIATAAETTTGTDATRAVSPDGLAGSDYGKRPIQIKLVDDDTALSTGDGALIIVISSELNGYNLVDADAAVTTVSSSGTPTYQIRNVTDSHDMLSTAITIDANEYTSYTAATAPVINTSYDDVATGDLIAIDKDVAGTGEKGDIIILTFQLP